MYAIMRTSPVAWSCAIAGTRPPDLSKSMSMGNPCLRLAFDGRHATACRPSNAKQNPSIPDQTEHIVRAKALAAVQERQFYEDANAGDLGVGLVDQFAGGFKRATRGEQVVDH